MNLTTEQQTIVSHIKTIDPVDESIVLIDSVAGSGKTTLLVNIAKELDLPNGLYLAYNKSIATEAKKKFPKSVNCSTTHSLAYQAVVKPYNLLLGDFSYRSIKERITYEHKLEIVNLIKEFCLSRFLDFDSFAEDASQLVTITPFTISLCNSYLAKMYSSEIECTHDFYLKVFHLALADNLIDYPPFSYVMLDECVVGRTGIKTDNGVMSITSLYNLYSKGKKLPLAKSYNHKTGVFEYKPIVEVFSNGKKDTLTVTTTSGIKLKATANHKVMTQRGYVEISNLVPLKDYIVSDTLTSYVESVIEGKAEKVYDLSVLDNNNYITTSTAGKDCSSGLLVHNCGDVNEVTLEIFKLLPAKIKIGTGDACIPGHVKVLTDKGWRTMSSVHNHVKEGSSVLVKSYNHVTNEFEFKPVLASVNNGVKPTLKFSTTRSTFECTDNHKILTPQGYTEAGSLKVGDIILKDGSSELKSVKRMLNKDQWHVLLGSFLGDGNLHKCSNSGKELRLRLGHSEKQLPYLQWKAHAMGGVAVKTTDAMIKTIKDVSCNISSQYTFTSKVFVLDRAMTLASVRHLNPLSLAIWVMDDGSIKNKYKDPDKNFSITIDSNNFSLRENEFFAKVLKKNFGLDTTIQRTRDYYRLSFNSVNTNKLIDIIKPYINECFIGKFIHKPVTILPLDNKFSSYAADVISGIAPVKSCEVFDITVKDNHNFIVSSTAQKTSASGVIVHNCQNIYQFNHTINAFDVLKDSATIFSMTKSFRVSSLIAVEIEQFVQKYIDPSMQFEGTPISDKSISSRAFISRTNSTLIAKMIELQKSDTPYTLLRRVDDIFKHALMVSSFKYQGTILDSTYKHVQEDIDNFYEELLPLNKNAKLLPYLLQLHEHDFTLQRAIKLVLQHGPKAIYSAYDYAKSHETKTTSNSLVLATAHSVKG